MASRYLARSLSSTTRKCFFSCSISRGTASSARPLAGGAFSCYGRSFGPVFGSRAFATRQTSSSLNDPNPNWSNRPPKETILLDGCDFEHWLVVMEKPEGDPTRDEIIDSYIKTLSMVVGSEEEARMKIYSVSTRHYFAFGALVSEELSYKLKELPKVRWVLPDSYLDVRNKDYGGEPFVNGQAVPYDPKYHEEWVRNNARANERNRRNDRPRNFDRSRNFERRRELQMNNQNAGANFGGPVGNMGPPPTMAPPPLNSLNVGPVQPIVHQPPNNIGGQTNNVSAVPSNMQVNNQEHRVNVGGAAGNMGAPPTMTVPPQNTPDMGARQPNVYQPPNNNGGLTNNAGSMPSNNMGGRPNYGGAVVPNNNMVGQPNYGGGMPQNNNLGGNVNYGGGTPSNSMGSRPSYGEGMLPNNMGGPSNYGGGMPHNMGGQPNYGMNTGSYPPNNMRGVPNSAANSQYGNAHNSGAAPYQSGPGPSQNAFPPYTGSGPGSSPNSYAPNTGIGPGQNEKNYAPNAGYASGQGLNSYAPNVQSNPRQHQNDHTPNMGGTAPYQNQNSPGRDAPLPRNY